MNLQSEIRNFVELSPLDKARFLVRFMYELTLEAQGFYTATGVQDIEVPKLRFINEIQHRLTRFIEQILIDDPARPTDEMMLRLMLAPRAQKNIEDMMLAAYFRTMQVLV